MTSTAPQGAPRSAYADSDFVIVRGEAVRLLGSWEAAGVWQRLAWRCEREPDGEWRATLAEIADEVWLSLHKTRRAVDVIRERGWLASRPTSVLDSTLLWSIPWRDESPQPGEGFPRPPLGNPSAKGEEFPHPSSYREETDAGDATDAADAALAPERIAEHFNLRLSAIGCQPKSVTAPWLKAARDLLATRAEEDVRHLIDLALSESFERGFWLGPVTSLPKLRDHASKIEQQAKRSKGAAGQVVRPVGDERARLLDEWTKGGR